MAPGLHRTLPTEARGRTESRAGNRTLGIRVSAARALTDESLRAHALETEWFIVSGRGASERPAPGDATAERARNPWREVWSQLR